MTKYYVPYEDINDYSCYVVYDSQTIRAYKNNLTIGDNDYTDFFVNSHYMQKDGVQHISSTIEMPVCLGTDSITNEKFYRNDIAHILVFVSFVLFFIFLAIRIFSRIFGKWMKL